MAGTREERLEGTPFGHYRLLALLGRGGMGEVWRAYDTLTDRAVAVKVLPAHLVDDEQFQRRFRREARTAAALDEPHIVPIHRYGEIDGRLYVDMRLVEGRDLHAVIADHPLDPGRAVGVIEQIAAALDAAHGVGLVHRDVKPSNILIGDFDFAYLIDFGIARAAGDVAVTDSGEVMGTWAYMAPERFDSDQMDPRSDTYALACVLHECLTGRRPYPGRSVEQQVAGHLTATPPRPSVDAPGVPAAFDDVIARGLAKDPDHRFQTNGELARAARAAVTNDAPRPLLAPARPRNAPGRDEGPDTVGRTEVNSDGGDEQTVAVTRYDTAETVATTGIALPEMPTPEAVTRSRWRPRVLIPALIAAAALLGGGVLATPYIRGMRDIPDTRGQSATPDAATFNGTYTTTYGPQTTFDGTPKAGTVPPETWVVRSSCNHDACVATATTTDRPEGTLTRTFDHIDGRWVAVTTDPGRCNDADSQHWERVTLQPRPDGSLDGQFSSADENGNGNGNGCPSTASVTYTRTGDPRPGVDVTDPATVPPRVANPAQAFHGRYRLTTPPEYRGTSDQSPWAVTTMCLRDGGRCLTYEIQVAEDSGARQLQPLNAQLVFAAGRWTEKWSLDDTCKGTREPSHEDYTGEYPLPAPVDDPLAELTGHVTERYTGGGCAGTDTYDVVLRRLGD